MKNSKFFVTLILICSLSTTVPTTAQTNRRVSQTSFPAQVDTLPLDATLATFGRLGGMSVDSAGTIYCSNFGASLWKITPAGQVTQLQSTFLNASGNTVTPDGRLLQADFGRNRIFEINPISGVKNRIVGQGLVGPVGLVATDNGTLFVACCNGQFIARVQPGSSTATVFATSRQFNCPNGIELGPSGELYVINFNDDKVLKVGTGGNVSVFAKLGTSGLGASHVVRVGDELYVTKLGSHDLYRVSISTGAVSMVAGREALPGFRDGPGWRDGSFSRALLRYPNGIAASPTGDTLYLNTLRGPRTGGLLGELVIRRVLLP